jgi:hypothetical protein
MGQIGAAVSLDRGPVGETDLGNNLPYPHGTSDSDSI